MSAPLRLNCVTFIKNCPFLTLYYHIGAKFSHLSHFLDLDQSQIYIASDGFLVPQFLPLCSVSPTPTCSF